MKFFSKIKYAIKRVLLLPFDFLIKVNEIIDSKLEKEVKIGGFLFDIYDETPLSSSIENSFTAWMTTDEKGEPIVKDASKMTIEEMIEDLSRRIEITYKEIQEEGK